MNLTVGKKISLGFASVLILLLIMVSFAYYGMASTQQTYEDILSGRVQTINQVRDLLSSGKEIQLNCRSYLLVGNKQSLTKFNDAINKYNQLSEKLTVRLNQGQEKLLLNELNGYINQYISAANQAITLKDQKDAGYLTVIAEKGTPLINGFNIKFNEMINFQNNELSKVQKDTAKKVDNLQNFLMLLSVAALILGCFISYFMGRQISKPIRKIAKAAGTIASGDLTQKEIKIKSKDEIGDLAVAFNQMQFNLKQIILQINESAEQMAAASEELYATTEQTSQATELISSSIQEVSAGAELQVKSSEENAAAMGEVASGSKQIAESASFVKNSANEAQKLAKQGNDSIQRAIVQMNLIEKEAKIPAPLLRNWKNVQMKLEIS